MSPCPGSAERALPRFSARAHVSCGRVGRVSWPTRGWTVLLCLRKALAAAALQRWAAAEMPGVPTAHICIPPQPLRVCPWPAVGAPSPSDRSQGAGTLHGRRRAHFRDRLCCRCTDGGEPATAHSLPTRPATSGAPRRGESKPQTPLPIPRVRPGSRGAGADPCV